MRASMSDINSFLACRLQWHWGSLLNLEPRHQTDTALAVGTGIHRALERWYHPDFKYDYAAVLEQSLSQLFLGWYTEQSHTNGFTPWDGAELDLAEGMLAGYQAQYGPLPTDDPDIDHMLATEQEFDVAVPGTQHALIGTIDGLMLSRSGTLWLVDHKTYSYAPSPNALARNQQFLGYTWAANQLLASGKLTERFGPLPNRVEGVLYNGLRKKLPTSRTSAPFFKREWLRHDANELAFFETHLRTVLYEMNRPDRADYYAPGMHCDRCAFQSPCLALQYGEDFEYALRTNYAYRKPRGTVYVREGEEDADAS